MGPVGKNFALTLLRLHRERCCQRPGAATVTGGGAMTSTAKKSGHLRAVEQAQQSLEYAAVACGGVELEGKSASIKSSSECIQLSNALSLFSRSVSFFSCSVSFFSCSISLSSCLVLCSERSICISTTGSRRQLSIRKNERKGESDEPDAPLLREGENSAWEGDVVIRRKQSNQANNTANNGFQQSFAIKPQPPPGRWSIQIQKMTFHPKQRNPTLTSTSLVHQYFAMPTATPPDASGLLAGRWCPDLLAQRGTRIT